MNSIFTRRSVRHFTDQRVEEEKVEKLLRAAMQAPSARNQQPWEFVVIRGKQNLHYLSQYATNLSPVEKASVGILVLADPKRLILPRAWEQDLGCACENILLEATELGLGAFWGGISCTVPEEKWPQINRAFAMPQDYYVYAVMCIGYPNKNEANHYVDRFDPSRIHYINN